MPITLTGPGPEKALAQESVSTDSIAKTLNNGVVFIAVYTHMWTGQAKIRNALVKLGKEELARELVTNPRWNLLPDAWRKKFSAVHSQIQKVIDQSSIGSDEISFPIRGVHIMARRAYPEFATQVKEIEKNDFQPLVSQFVKHWPDIIEEFRQKITEASVWSTLSSKFPSQTKLAEKFWVEIIRVPIKLGTDTTLEAVDDREMQDIVAQGQRFTKSIANLVVKGLEDELRDSIDNLLDRIRDKGVIKQGTLEMVKTAFKKLQDFDFVMTDELKAKINANKTLLADSDCKELNHDIRHDSGAMADSLVKYLQVVREQSAADANITRAFGRGRRSIRT
jgi:hypothetical protein